MSNLQICIKVIDNLRIAALTNRLDYIEIIFCNSPLNNFTNVDQIALTYYFCENIIKINNIYIIPMLSVRDELSVQLLHTIFESFNFILNENF